MTKKHFDVPGFIHWSMGVWCFSKWSRNVYCIRIKSFTSRPWMRWWVINQPIFWYSLMASWTKLLGWLLLMEGTPAVDMVKKIPLFTTGETYMSGGVLSSPDFWLPSTVVAFIGKNIGTWNPQSPPKLKVDGNGEINNHFPCKSSSIEVSPIETVLFLVPGSR